MKMKRRRHTQGQGLVEFALILPILLLIMVGIMEFGRVFVIYVNLSNASREGARYGIVNPTDYEGINEHVRENITIVPPNDVDINVYYDTGPGGETFTNPQYVSVGDRVIVQVTYQVQALTGLMDPFISNNLVINIRNARTIQSLKRVGTGTPSPAPTPTSDGTTTPTPDLPTPTSTPEVWPTPTPTTPPTATPTPTPLPPIVIERPVWEGETTVNGTAAPGQAVTLRIVQTGWQQTVNVAADGTFIFSGLAPLIGGYTLIVQGYGNQDLTVVQEIEETPTPTPTPSQAFIVLEPTCTDENITHLIVQGYNWPAQARTVNVYWDRDLYPDDPPKCTVTPSGGTFTCEFDLFVPTGEHTVLAEGLQNAWRVLESATATLVRPCPGEPTPTPTPAQMPDLRVIGIALDDEEPLGTYETLHLTVGIENQGERDVASLFWVDLYADPDPTTPLAEQASDDYVAINALSAGSAISFTMYVPGGFDSLGAHTIQVMVDTWDQIAESDETNNVSQPFIVNITQENPYPTPTPTPIAPPETPGSIQGITYLNGTPQSNVSVYVYDAEGRLWGSGRSDVNGNYLITDLPPNEYIVVGMLRLGEVLYRGQIGPITVNSGRTTIGVDLDLVEVNP